MWYLCWKGFRSCLYMCYINDNLNLIILDLVSFPNYFTKWTTSILNFFVIQGGMIVWEQWKIEACVYLGKKWHIWVSWPLITCNVGVSFETIRKWASLIQASNIEGLEKMELIEVDIVTRKPRGMQCHPYMVIIYIHTYIHHNYGFLIILWAILWAT